MNENEKENDSLERSDTMLASMVEAGIVLEKAQKAQTIQAKKKSKTIRGKTVHWINKNWIAVLAWLSAVLTATGGLILVFIKEIIEKLS